MGPTDDGDPGDEQQCPVDPRLATYVACGAIYGRSRAGFARWLAETDQRFAREALRPDPRRMPPPPPRERPA